MSERSKEEILKELVSEINGAFVEGHYGNDDSVEVEFQGVKIIFVPFYTYRQNGSGGLWFGLSKISARFIQEDNFKFSIHRKGVLSTIAKLFGAQDILTGDEEF